MEYKRIIDTHTHTDHSFDGHCSTTFLCEQAVTKGLRAIAFTDHVEMDFFYQDSHDRRAVQSYFEIVKARSAFRGQILVCAGVEMGQPMYDVQASDKLMGMLDYDFVIGSVHNLRGMKDFWYIEYEKYDAAGIDKLLREYFDEIQLMVDWGKFDTLAHLTYPLRYICGEHNIPIDIRDYSVQIESILKSLVKSGKALEINTSGLRQKLGKTMPDEDIVSLYKSLGGELITLGSDAHYAEHLGAGIPEGMDIAKRCGFDSIALFQKREPVMIPIE